MTLDQGISYNTLTMVSVLPCVQVHDINLLAFMSSKLMII